MRAQAGVLGGCLALVFACNLSGAGLVDASGLVKGTDFLHFYVLGSLVLNHQPAAVYDVHAQTAAMVALVPESRGVYYLPIYGPQVALLYAPLAALPYGWALAVWLFITAAVYAACLIAVWRQCPALAGEGRLVALVAAASPAFFNLLAHGQNSAIALASFTLAYFALKRGWRFGAGVAIGMLVFKPQLGAAAACVFVLTGAWPVVAGALVGAGAQLGLAWAWFGMDVMLRYWETLRHVGNIAPLLDIKPYQMHSLLAFWRLILPAARMAEGLYLVCALAVIAGLIAIWRRSTPLPVRFGALLVATVLVCPHLNVYDLVILAPALLLLADWWLTRPHDEARRAAQVLLYAAYVLPLFGVVTRYTHVQLSVLAIAGLFVATAARVLKEAAVPRPAALAAVQPA